MADTDGQTSSIDNLNTAFAAKAATSPPAENAAEEQIKPEDLIEHGKAWEFVMGGNPRDAKIVPDSDEIVERLKQRISIHPEAKQLIEQFEELGGKVIVVSDYSFREFGGVFSPDDGRIYLNGDLNEDLLVGFLAHELRHGAYQYGTLGAINIDIDSINDFTTTGVYSWLYSIEADAQTFAIDVVYRLALNGDMQPGIAIIKNSEKPGKLTFARDMLKAYDEHYTDEPGGIDRARARTFEAWFKSDARNVYTPQAHRLYRQSLTNIGFHEDVTQYVIGHDAGHDLAIDTFSQNELSRLGIINGRNYMAHVTIDPSDPDYIRSLLPEHIKEQEPEILDAIENYLSKGIPPIASMAGYPVQTYTLQDVEDYKVWRNDDTHNWGMDYYVRFRENGWLKYVDDWKTIENSYINVDPMHIHTAQFEEYAKLRDKGLLDPKFILDSYKRNTPEDIDKILAHYRVAELRETYFATQDTGDEKLLAAYGDLIKRADAVIRAHPEFSEITMDSFDNPMRWLDSDMRYYLIDGDAEYLYQNLYWHEFQGEDDVILNHLKPEIEALVKIVYEREGLTPPDFSKNPYDTPILMPEPE